MEKSQYSVAPQSLSSTQTAPGVSHFLKEHTSPAGQHAAPQASVGSQQTPPAQTPPLAPPRSHGWPSTHIGIAPPTPNPLEVDPLAAVDARPPVPFEVEPAVEDTLSSQATTESATPEKRADAQRTEARRASERGEEIITPAYAESVTRETLDLIHVQ